MCGRFTLLADELEIMKEFGLQQEIDDYQPRYNIAPSQQVLAVINDGEKNRAGYLKWGLVPSFAKDSKIGYKMINARAETANEKPSFKRLLQRNRCLIIADSFYEWKKEGNEKTPLRITMKNRELFAFAGLWDRWQNDDKELVTCTILTKNPNTFMSQIHNRMPIILPKEKEQEWIKPEKRNPDEVRDFLLSINIDEMTAYPVSSYVNSPKHDDKSCIQALVE